MSKSKNKNFSVSSDMKDLLGILGGGGVYTAEELSDEMNRTKERIRRIVAKIRGKFNEGHEDFTDWIFSTSGGYTTDEKAEHASHETRMRMGMAMGLLTNGIHPMRTMKRLLPREFETLQIEYRPKLIQMGKIIK